MTSQLSVVVPVDTLLDVHYNADRCCTALSFSVSASVCSQKQTTQNHLHKPHLHRPLVGEKGGETA